MAPRRRFNDREETAAIKTVFGEHAYKLAISSTKSMSGHMVGAAGAMEVVADGAGAARWHPAADDQLSASRPQCDLDYVPNTARKADIRVALSNSMGFGGHNAVVALKKYEG